METEVSIIKEHEEQNINNIQPSGADEIIELLDSPPPIRDLESMEEIRETVNNMQEEPIDLTFDKGCVDENYQQNRKTIVIPSKTSQVFLNKTRGQFSKEIPKGNFNAATSCNQLQLPYCENQFQLANASAVLNYTIVGVDTSQTNVSNRIPTRQQDVMKMAKSIFSKRTRTLYHWMYPSASKQQIKQVVSNTWESMEAQEKNIYIGQVLGRFGYNNVNLMINPQLGQIRELPPMPGIEEFKSKTNELQNAISSISNETENVESCYSNEPPTKKARTSRISISQEFEDDPELSQELAQFSIMLKNQF